MHFYNKNHFAIHTYSNNYLQWIFIIKNNKHFALFDLDEN